MKHMRKILQTCILVTATWVFISLVVIAKDKDVIAEDKKPHKPDIFQCPQGGTTLQWTDDELWRGYIECRSGWTAATPTPVTQDDWWVYIVPTNAGWKVETMCPEWGKPE